MIKRTPTKLETEINNINYAGRNIKHHAYVSMVVHTKEYDFPIDTVLSYDVVKDFSTKLSDNITVKFYMLKGDFIKHVIPNRDNLRCTITYRVISKKYSVRYKMIIKGLEGDIKEDEYKNISQDRLNQQGVTELDAQLVSETILELKDKQVYGVYRDVDVGSVITTLFNTNMMGSIFNGLTYKRKLNMLPPDNSRVYKHIIVPDTTKLLELPSFLQNGDIGVYNGDIGVYLELNDTIETFHISPLYRPPYGKEGRKLKVYAASSDTVSAMSNTYVLDDEYLTIVASTSTTYDQLGNMKHLEYGIGLNAMDPSTALRRPVEVGKDKVKTTTEWNKNQKIHKKREDGYTNVKPINPTDNLYKQRSTVLRHDGLIVNLRWYSSNMYYLTPFMYVILYMDNGKDQLIERHGILLGIHTVYDTEKFTESSVLSVFVVNDDKTDTKLSGLDVLDLF